MNGSVSTLRKLLERFPRVKGLLRRLFGRLREFEEIKFNRNFHNDNRLFYTLSPALLPAIVKAFAEIRTSSPHLLLNGAYYEFGLFKGFSLWFAEQISREFRGPDFRFYGFDSFAGLPQSHVDKTPWWQEGNYAASKKDVLRYLELNGAQLTDIVLVEGFFGTDLFKQFEKTDQPSPPAILVIDSDIYESCAVILQYFGSRLAPGAMILLDDFNAFEKSNEHGERRAMIEFERDHPSFQKEHAFSFGTYGEAYRVIRAAAS